MLLEPILVLLGGLFLGWLARQIDDGDALQRDDILRRGSMGHGCAEESQPRDRRPEPGRSAAHHGCAIRNALVMASWASASRPAALSADARP